MCRDYLPINPSGDAFQFEVDAWTNYKQSKQSKGGQDKQSKGLPVVGIELRSPDYSRSLQQLLACRPPLILWYTCLSILYTQ